MDFTLTEEQELLRGTARSLLGAECPSSLLRRHAEDASVAGELFDRHLREWVALGDGPVVDLCLFLEEAGAVLLPGPFFATTALFVPLARTIGHDEADEAAAGAVTGTVALAGEDGVWRPSRDPVRRFVPEVDQVDRVAVVLPGPSVAVVEASTLACRPLDTIDSTRRTFEITVPDGVEAASIDHDALDRVVAGATVGAAAELLGVSRWLLDTTVAYVRERVQFDRPVGSFQGLQWKLVDMALDHERAAAAVYYAAMALDAGDPDAQAAAHVAKAAAGSAARHGGRTGLQAHGGIGYTWEHDLHLYLRRAYAGDDLFGDAAWHHDRLADLALARP